MKLFPEFMKKLFFGESVIISRVLDAWKGRAAILRQRKKYLKIWDKQTGRTLLLHRKIAEDLLGRPLLPREIVHHRDGDSTNNAPDNLLVLPDQRYHAHIEFHLRCEKRGMPNLFPEFLQAVKEDRQGTLFESILAF